MRNGRPYTDENGCVDAALITDRTPEEQKLVMDWIKANFRRSGKLLRGHTSYGLKHILHDDTGIYVTNNEFKDAMLQAGFHPVSALELNWRSRAVYVKELNENPSPFFIWVKKKYLREDSPLGDFAKDMARDFSFPTKADHNVIFWYLIRIGACDGAMDCFDKLWKEFSKCQKS